MKQKNSLSLIGVGKKEVPFWRLLSKWDRLLNLFINILRHMKVRQLDILSDLTDLTHSSISK